MRYFVALILGSILLLTGVSQAQEQQRGRTIFAQLNGTSPTAPYQVNVDHTDNGDGTINITTSGASISDAAYGVAWNGDTTTAPSKNAVYDKIETLAGGHNPVTVTDSASIDFTLTGQDITGTITESDPIGKYTIIPFTFKPLSGTIILNTVLNKTMGFAGTITGFRVASPSLSSITIQVNKSTTASPDQRTYTEISGTEDIVLSSAYQNQDLSLTTWTTTFAKGDTIQFQVTSATAGNPNDVVQGVLYVTKTGA